MTIFSHNTGIEKLQNVLINDKHINPELLNDVLKSDLFALLENYMDISKSQIITKLEVDEQGNYIFRCKARASRLKSIGILPY